MHRWPVAATMTLASVGIVLTRAQHTGSPEAAPPATVRSAAEAVSAPGGPDGRAAFAQFALWAFARVEPGGDAAGQRSEVDRIVRTFLQRRRIPSAAVAVVRDLLHVRCDAGGHGRPFLPGGGMMRITTLIAAAGLAVAGAFAARAQAPSPDLFAYDASQPLEIQSAVLEEPPGAIVYDVSYASPKGGRVTALLVAPRATGRHAGILFGHWGGGDRTEFLPEAILYARAGAVSLLPAYPWTRPAPWRKGLKYSSDPAHDFEVYVQAVVDLRRGFDLLSARPDVDPARLAYVGHSYGAQWGAILSAIDRRMKATVLVAGVPDLAAIYQESDEPEYVELRTSDPKRVERLLAVMAPLAAAQYVGRASPIPLLFQFARYEQAFPRAAMDRYFSAARQPKEIRWYPTAHDMNDPQALVDRAAWLKDRIGIGQVLLPGGAGQ